MTGYVKDWNIFFDNTDHREHIANSMRIFLEDLTSSHIEIVGFCKIEGRIYGYGNGENDGASFMSSPLKTIDRVAPDLMCANTMSGSKYYFNPKDHAESFTGYVASGLVLF